MLASELGVSVPVCVSGLVTRIDIDICQDGAKYRITSTIGDYRVKPRNNAVEGVLSRVAGSRMPIGVCGDLRWGTCAYFDAYWAGPPERLTELAESDELRATEGVE